MQLDYTAMEEYSLFNVLLTVICLAFVCIILAFSYFFVVVLCHCAMCSLHIISMYARRLNCSFEAQLTKSSSKTFMD